MYRELRGIREELAMCRKYWNLYCLYLKADETTVAAKSAALTRHLHECGECQKEIVARKAGPANPELTPAEIEAA